VKSCYAINGKRIFYHELFSAPPQELVKAIGRIVPAIYMARVEKIVLSTEGISDMRNEYLSKSLYMRYDQILFPSLK